MTATITREERRPFGRRTGGLEVSPLGFGGAPIGLLESEESAARAVLELLLDHGVNVIDTAAMYRGSEGMIGRTIGHRRDDFVLISKCGHSIEECSAPAWSPELVTASVERSLQRLATDRIDVMLLHSCDLDVLERGEALGALLEARSAGKIRYVGYSGDNEEAAYAAGLDEIAVLQTSISLCDQRNIDLALPIAGRNGVGVMAKRPIANGAWKKQEQQYERYLDYARPYHERFATMGLTLEELKLPDAPANPAEAWAEIALRFTLSIPGVHTAIIGTTRADHAAANLRAAAKGPLPDAAVATIRAAFQKSDPEGTWEGLR